MKKKSVTRSTFFNPRFAIAFVLCMTGAFIALGGARVDEPGLPAWMPSEPTGGGPFTFHNTGSLNTAHLEHTATLLSNGKVLVAGGVNNGV